ncbi:MAG TPA: hypothetical protein VK586_22825 [Streptosporangiaceae bacterium]|nr:hypothetical protein [Streptosporangiaceae bacterium]
MTVDDKAPAVAAGYPGTAPAEPVLAARDLTDRSRAGESPAALRGGRSRGRLLALTLVLVPALLVLVVHDVGYLLRTPFWTDETWVAATTRFGLAKLPQTTSSTPIGWSVLLRLFTVSGTQVARLLPLAFAGAAVVMAGWLGRGIGWRVRGAPAAAGLLAALGVLLVPGMLTRDDLKQYTADACLALLALAATSRLERDWSRRWLAGLSLAVWGGMLFSDAVAFIGIAAFGAVVGVQLARRAWRRLAEAAVAAAVTAVLMAVVYEAFDARAVLPGLTYSPHFRNFYLPVGQGWQASIAFLAERFEYMRGYFGLGPLWLAVPLFAAGLITIFRLGRPATAVALAALWPEMLVISALHKYPFLDERTSTFLFAVTVVTAAIGVAGACCLLRPWLKGALAAAVAVAAVAAFALGAQPYLRAHPIPGGHGDIRGQTQYVAAHAAPGDVILVNLSSSWGFAYYWPAGRPSIRPDAAVLQEYEAYFPDQPRIVVASSRDPAGVSAALSRALARVRAQAQARPAACIRIWLVRTHVSPDELAAWRAALAQRGLDLTHVGDAGLSVVPAAGSCTRLIIVLPQGTPMIRFMIATDWVRKTTPDRSRSWRRARARCAGVTCEVAVAADASGASAMGGAPGSTGVSARRPPPDRPRSPGIRPLRGLRQILRDHGGSPAAGSSSTVCSSPQVNRARYRPGRSGSSAVNSVLHRVGASSPECRTAPNRRSTSPTTHPQGRRSATVASSGAAQSPARTSQSCTTAPPGTAMVSNHSPGHSSSSHWVISQVRSPNSRWSVRAGRPSTMR